VNSHQALLSHSGELTGNSRASNSCPRALLVDGLSALVPILRNIRRGTGLNRNLPAGSPFSHELAKKGDAAVARRASGERPLRITLGGGVEADEPPNGSSASRNAEEPDPLHRTSRSRRRKTRGICT